MVEITQKMEGATALVGGMAVLGALSLLVIFALHSIVGTTEFTLVTSLFCGVGCGPQFLHVTPSSMLTVIGLNF